jgi:hypothetical protein
MTQSWSSFNAEKRCEPPQSLEKISLTGVLLEFAIQPGTGKCPRAFSRRDRDSERRRGFGRGQTAEETQLHQLGLGRLFDCKPGQGLVERQDIVRRLRDLLTILKIDASSSAAMTDCPFAPGRVHENSPHGLRSGGEEVAPVVPVLFLSVSDQPKVSLVHQGGRFESLSWFLMCQALSSQSAQLVVHQRQQLSGRLRVTGLYGVNDLGDFVHEVRAEFSLGNSWDIEPAANRPLGS